MPDELRDALEEFARFGRSLKGDEKSEAQTFLDHFFRRSDTRMSSKPVRPLGSASPRNPVPLSWN